MVAYIAFRIAAVLYFLVVAATIVVVILEKRQPVKTMAWTLVLMALPVLGLLLFYFFGQDVRKERRLVRREIKSLLRKDLAAYIPHAEAAVPERYATLANFFMNRNFAPPLTFNDVQVFRHATLKMQALLGDIAGARHHINLEYFILADDALGLLLRDFLADAARRGVKVRVMYDDVGCWHAKARFFAGMRAAGIEVEPFMPVRFSRLTRRVNYRNHRKIAVIDGRIGYIGGMNIAQRYLGTSGSEEWRDMHLRLTGSAVYGLQQSFVADWYYNSGTLLPTDDFYPAIPETGNGSGGTVQIVAASPASDLPYIMNGFVWALLNARRYFYLATPYLMPTEQVLSAIQTAAGAGVDVRIMVPQNAEHFWIRKANESYYGDVMQAGAKVYAYGPGFLHAKYFVSDDMLATVGSTNTDFRSFEDSFEVNAFVYDAQLTRQLKASFEADMESCIPIDADAWRRRPKARKACESFVRILAPLL
jgi:cardiolipin synthase A/B